jgi:thiamine-phosphate pyrophosphorylase
VALLYYITDRTHFPGDEQTRRRHLFEKITEAVHHGVDYIQLREKDLSTRDLETLSRVVVDLIKKLRTENQELRTALLINSRPDIALAVKAQGVHLRSNDISPNDVRKIWQDTNIRPIVAVSCHSQLEVAHAASENADFAVLAPIFNKQNIPTTTGLDALHKTSQEQIPVLALGGVTLENAHACLKAGAAGIAGIRLFQQNEIQKVVAALRFPSRSSHLT